MIGGALAMAIVLFVAVNIFSNVTFTAARLDLTEDGLFSVADGTREVLASTDEPIVLRLFLSDVLAERAPGLANYAARVRELLEHYTSLADGKIRLEIYHPEPFSIEEDRALAFGLQGIPVTSSGDLAYFGLAGTNSTDDTEVISVFSPRRDRFLEYDLTQLIHDLADPEKAIIGVISSLPISADPTRRNAPGLIHEQMRSMFEVRTVRGDFVAIDDELDALMVVQPGPLSEQALFAIDQFVLGGGKLLAFVDPFGEAALPFQQRGVRPTTEHGLERLFGRLGHRNGTRQADRRPPGGATGQRPGPGPQRGHRVPSLAGTAHRQFHRRRSHPERDHPAQPRHCGHPAVAGGCGGDARAADRIEHRVDGVGSREGAFSARPDAAAERIRTERRGVHDGRPRRRRS